MKPIVLACSAALALSACAGSRSAPPATAPTPTPAQGAGPGRDPVRPAVALREAPRNWQLLDDSVDHVPGISAERAERELLRGRAAKQTVIVAVIDGGVDTAHVDLRANLWTNSKEVAGNAKDDDGNGYTDDTRGWNFIGGRDGRDVRYDTFEVTRLYVRCTAEAEGRPPAGLPPIGQQECRRVADRFDRQRSEARTQLGQFRDASEAMTKGLPILRRAVGSDSLTVARVQAIRPNRPDLQEARNIYLLLAANGITPAELEETRTALESQINYGLNTNYDSRTIVGDNYADPSERRYGNTDVTGPDAKHGTHVAGIIAAVRGNNVGIDGIAPAVRVLTVRAVPDGDERDKDVANAIRYAVDNGARVINMSFGKSFSPYKATVDEAVKYADAHNVLMVHAAGNDGENADSLPSYPTPVYASGGRAQNWIEVGASSWKGADSLAASFSNYGHTLVDVFAPGVDILSTVPGNGYERLSGTSMAAPVVSGLAALIMAHYPTLTAAQVKRVILDSSTRYADRQVARPGESAGARVAFSTLSVTGGVVNAYAALKMAEQMSGQSGAARAQP